MKLYAADCTGVESETEPSTIETAQFRWFAPDAVEQMVRDGHVQNGFTLAALYSAKLRGLI